MHDCHVSIALKESHGLAAARHGSCPAVLYIFTILYPLCILQLRHMFMLTAKHQMMNMALPAVWVRACA